MTLSERIKNARSVARISQQELADKTGVSLTTVSRWETNKRSPRMEEIKKISQVLNISVEELIGDRTTLAMPIQTQNDSLIHNVKNQENISDDDLDLGYWGNMVEKVRRIAHSNDPRRPLIVTLLSSAMNELTDKGTVTSINAYNGDNSSYNGNVLQAMKVV